jgi:hypothetical protein
MDPEAGTGSPDAAANAPGGRGQRDKPMTGPEHSRRAQELLDEAQQAAASGTTGAADRYALKIAEAQVHATLALAVGGPRRPFWYGWLVLAFAALCAGLAILGYDWLASSYSAVIAGASTDNLAALQAVKMSGSGVQWMQQGLVQELDVTGPAFGTAQVTLPLPVAECATLAAALGTKCQGGNGISVSHPVEFIWNGAQEVSSSGGSAGSSELTISTSLGTPRALGVTVTAQTDTVPTACFGPPAAGEILTVKGGPSPYRYPHGTPADWQDVCSAAGFANGIVVSVTLPAPHLGQGLPPAFEFGGISRLAVCASGPDGTLQGFTGQINLNPGGTTTLGNPATVVLHAVPVTISLDVGPESQFTAPMPCSAGMGPPSVCHLPASPGSLALCSTSATSVTTSSGQLVPSNWARNSAVAVPVFGGLVTALVVAPLGAAVQVLMDAMKGWRFRRRRQGPETTKDVRNAS